MSSARCRTSRRLHDCTEPRLLSPAMRRALLLLVIAASGACIKRTRAARVDWRRPAATAGAAPAAAAPPPVDDYTKPNPVQEAANARIAGMARTDLVGPAGLGAFKVMGESKKVEVSTVPVTGQPFTEAMRLAIKEPSTHEWAVQLQAPTAIPVTNGEAILATFYARAEQPQEGSVGETEFLFELGRSPYSKSVDVSDPARARVVAHPGPLPARSQLRRRRGQHDLPPGLRPADDRAGRHQGRELRQGDRRRRAADQHDHRSQARQGAGRGRQAGAGGRRPRRGGRAHVRHRRGQGDPRHQPLRLRHQLAEGRRRRRDGQAHGWQPPDRVQLGEQRVQRRQRLQPPERRVAVQRAWLQALRRAGRAVRRVRATRTARRASRRWRRCRSIDYVTADKNKSVSEQDKAPSARWFKSLPKKHRGAQPDPRPRPTRSSTRTSS